MKLADLLCVYYPLYAKARSRGVSDEAIISHACAVIPEVVTGLATEEASESFNIGGVLKAVAMVGPWVVKLGKGIVSKFKKKYKVSLSVQPKTGSNVPPPPQAPTPEAPFPIWIPIVGGVVLVIIVIIIFVSGKKKK